MPTKPRRDKQQHKRKLGVERRAPGNHVKHNNAPNSDLGNQNSNPESGRPLVQEQPSVSQTPSDSGDHSQGQATSVDKEEILLDRVEEQQGGYHAPSVFDELPKGHSPEPHDVPRESRPSSQYTPRPFVSDVYCNRGFFGNVRAYRVGDFNDLLNAIRGKAQQHYDVLAPTRVKVTTPTGTMESWDAFKNYKGLEERVCFASTAQFETSDGLVKCEVYVGRPEDVLTKYHHMERSDALKTKAVRVGKKVAKNVGVMVAASLVGRALRRVSPLLGIIIREGGSLYGKSGNITTIYDELVPTPVCTIMVSPTDRPDTEFTREKNDAYLALVKSLGAFRYLSH